MRTRRRRRQRRFGRQRHRRLRRVWRRRRGGSGPAAVAGSEGRAAVGRWRLHRAASPASAVAVAAGRATARGQRRLRRRRRRCVTGRPAVAAAQAWAARCSSTLAATIRVIGGVTINGNSVTAGAGVTGGGDGSAFGSGLFLGGGGTILFDCRSPARRRPSTIRSATSSDHWRRSICPAMSLVKIGAGTMMLNRTNTYGGDTFITRHVQVASAASLGSGLVLFAGSTLAVTGTTTFKANVRPGAGDTLDVAAGQTATFSGLFLNDIEVPNAGLTLTGGGTVVARQRDQQLQRRRHRHRQQHRVDRRRRRARRRLTRCHAGRRDERRHDQLPEQLGVRDRSRVHARRGRQASSIPPATRRSTSTGRSPAAADSRRPGPGR